jgi:hypothetical protein
MLMEESSWLGLLRTANRRGSSATATGVLGSKRRTSVACLAAGTSRQPEPIIRTTPIPDVSPPVTHQSPLRLSAPAHAPCIGWATRAGRSPGSRLDRLAQPSRPISIGASGRYGQNSPLTVAGAATDCEREGSAPCSLFTRSCRCTIGNQHTAKQSDVHLFVKLPEVAAEKSSLHRLASDAIEQRIDLGQRGLRLR